MTTAVRAAALALLASVTTLVACDPGPQLEPAALSSAARTSPDTVADPPDDGAGEPPGAYLAMCAHYCDALESTLTYHCLQAGGTAAGCSEQAKATTGACYELRCLSGRATVSTCFLQCEGLNTVYAGYCAGADPGRQSSCPVSPDEHDRACRAGCSGTSAPDPAAPAEPIESAAAASRS
jgi:hypothetical protein